MLSVCCAAVTERALILVALAAVLLEASAAVAQDRTIDVDRFTPALDSDGFLGMQGTATPGPGLWNVGLVLDWTKSPLVLRVGGEAQDVIDHRLGADFLAQVGIGGRFAIALDAPLVLYQSTHAAPLADGGPAVAAVAAGDPRLVLRYRIYGEATGAQRERHEGPGIALLAAGSAPIGSQQAFAGEGAANTWLEALGDFHLLGAGAGVMLGWHHRFETHSLAGVVFRDELLAALSLQLPIPVTHDLFGLLEVRGATDAAAPFDGPRTALETDLGVKLGRGDLAFTGLVGRGLTQGVGSPALRVVVGVSWAPRVHDADGDGIPDDVDQCPHLPEDFDGFQDQDGCLDPDNDNDLVPDADNRCPNVAAVQGRDENEDGCTNPFRDRDHDGIQDADDACPNRPEDRDGFQDADGCPDPDNDHDGIPDRRDRCPNQAEDRDGFQDADGCPDPDNDHDGVLDAVDQCPNLPEDHDGFEDADGCPDPDNDHDGVLDADDRCPDQAETINSVQDEDGCPDRGGRSLWHVEGPATDGTVTLRGRIRFGRNDEPVHGAAHSVEQLAHQLIAHLPARFAIAIAGDASPPRAQALRAQLVGAEVPARSLAPFSFDPSLHAGVVVVTARAQRPRPLSPPAAPGPAPTATSPAHVVPGPARPVPAPPSAPPHAAPPATTPH